jgi:3-keto-L-gulonate-6-phosphate decarboxylase
MEFQWTSETVIHGAEFLLLLAGGYIGLTIKNAVADVREEQFKVKAELIERQHALQRDFDDKHAQNEKTIATHTASDEQQFRSIGQSLERIERKVERRNAGD